VNAGPVRELLLGKALWSADSRSFDVIYDHRGIREEPDKAGRPVLYYLYQLLPAKTTAFGRETRRASERSGVLFRRALLGNVTARWHRAWPRVTGVTVAAERGGYAVGVP